MNFSQAKKCNGVRVKLDEQYIYTKMYSSSELSKSNSFIDKRMRTFKYKIS